MMNGGIRLRNNRRLMQKGKFGSRNSAEHAIVRKVNTSWFPNSESAHEYWSDFETKKEENNEKEEGQQGFPS